MKNILKEIIDKAIKKLGYKNIAYSISLPPDPQMGDFSTNVAIILAGKNKKKPQEVADEFIRELKSDPNISKVEAAGVGFLNFTLSEKLYKDELENNLKLNENYGKSNLGKGKKVQVEYISANPTGPLHIGNARGGPIGLALYNLFKFLGYETHSEFYINDIGGQVNRFAESLYYWFAKKEDPAIPFPEGGYPGDYIKEISEIIQKEKRTQIAELKDKGEILELFKREGLYYTIKNIREDAEKLGIAFDKWVNQSDFEFSGKSMQVIKKLEEAGATTKKEGALWFKNPDDPALLDRESVLQKSSSDEALTYFADDIAYHADKFERGFDNVIDIWGANHAGHVPRLKSALEVLGYKNKLHIILYQWIRLKENGKAVSMGKRLGNFITIPDILKNGVEPDAFKYFILAQNPNTPFDFDLKLAADTSEKNPVYYIKYAHARICSILKKAGKGSDQTQKLDISLLKTAEEKNLYKKLVQFPEILEDISQNFQIQTLPHFIYEIAADFHNFYAHCPVIDEKNKALSAARLSLIVATKNVIYSALKICGISAPEKM